MGSFADELVHRDEKLLEKYGLKANDAILAEEKHLGLYDDLIQNYNAVLIAGGAAQNTARGAQVPLHSSPFHNLYSRMSDSTSSPPTRPYTLAASAATSTASSSKTSAPKPASRPNTATTKRHPPAAAVSSLRATTARYAPTSPRRTSTRWTI